MAAQTILRTKIRQLKKATRNRASQVVVPDAEVVDPPIVLFFAEGRQGARKVVEIELERHCGEKDQHKVRR